MIHRNRINRVKKLLKETQTNSALLLSSNPEIYSSWDQHYPYRANSDLFYMTGSIEPDLALLILPDKQKPILFGPKKNPAKILWDGEGASLKCIARNLDASIIETDKPLNEILLNLKNIEHLYAQSLPGSVSQQLLEKLNHTPQFQRYSLPRNILSAESIIETLRLYKDPSEIATIKKAVKITKNTLAKIERLIVPGATELQIANIIDFEFKKLDANLAFGTIVAAGRSAATLHYRKLDRTFQNGELVLIDCGAQYQMYNGDITRMFFVGDKRNNYLLDLHQIVSEAQKAGIKAIKHNVPIKKVYDAAAKVLTQGLIELKVIKGKTSKLFEKGAFKPYFPHGIGHSLGIDVHDVGNLRGNNNAILKEGMVFTVEPGLYFPKSTKLLPACGIRIEDDILVKKTAAEVL